MKKQIFPGLDVLVNSAGILMSGSVETLDIADYDKVRIGGSVLEPIFYALHSSIQHNTLAGTDIGNPRIVQHRGMFPFCCCCIYNSFSGDEH